MSIHITSMTAAQLSDQAHKLLDQGTALARLAQAMSEFEEAHGCTLFVSKAEPGTSYVGQGAMHDRGPEIVFAPRKPNVFDAAVKLASGGSLPKEAPEPAPEAPAAPETPPAAVLAPGAALPKPQTASSKQRPKPADRPWGNLNLAERRLVQHLEKLPAKFSPQEDLKIVELLTGGLKLPFVAATMELPQQDILARWNSFLTEDVLGANGKPSIDGQKQLLSALRYLKEQAA